MSSAAGRSAGRGRTLLLNLLLAVFSLLLMAALAEVLARAWVEVELARARADAPEVPLSRFHPVLGWEKTPLAAQRITRPEFDITLKVNSRGLRGPERDYPKPPGTRRLLILGDSFAAGYYVDEEQTLRAVLEGLLTTGGCGPAEVINGGTIAYSTDQEYLFYKTEGRRYAPDAVLLAFYYNDLYYNASPTGPGGEAKPYFEINGDALGLPNTPLRAPVSSDARNRANPGTNRPQPWRGSMALRLLSRRTVDAAPRLHAFLARFGLVQPPAHDPPREYRVFGLDHPREVSDMWARTRLLLKALRDDMLADGARLVLLYVPVRFEANDEAWELTRQRYRWGRRWDRGRVFERLAAIAGELAIPLVDPRDELRRTETGGWPTYYTRDVHWTSHGNAVAAHAAEREVRRALGCASGPNEGP
jgi:hypothetical protein